MLISPYNGRQFVKGAPLFSPIMVVDGHSTGSRFSVEVAVFNVVSWESSITIPPLFKCFQRLDGSLPSLVYRSH